MSRLTSALPRWTGDLVFYVVGSFLMQQVAMALKDPVVGSDPFWPSVGFAIGFLARQPIHRWPIFLVAEMVLELISNLQFGNPPAMIASFLAANMVEMSLGALILRRGLRHLLSDRLPSEGRIEGVSWLLARFFPTLAIAPILPAFMAGFMADLTGFTDRGMGLFALDWIIGDAVGIAVITPLLVIWDYRSARADRAGGFDQAPVLIGVVVLLVVLSMATADKRILWAGMLATMVTVCLVGIRTSPRIAALTAGGVSLAVSWLTARELGPFAVLTNPFEQVFALRAFVVAIMFIALLTSLTMSELQAARWSLNARDSAIETSTDGAAYVDLNGIHQVVNLAYATQLRTTPDKLIGTHWREGIAEQDLERLAEAVEDMELTGFGLARARGAQADGSPFDVEIMMIPDRGINGRLRGHHRFVRDVSEEHRLARQSNRLFEMNRHLLMISDRHQVIQRVNPEWIDQYGITPDQLVGRRMADLADPEDAGQLSEALEHSRTAGHEDIELTVRLRVADDEYRIMQLTSVYDRQDQLFYATAVDVTESRMLEESLAKARDHALSVSRMKSQFLATMSHEIRTPMNGVIGLTQLLDDTDLDDDQVRLVRGIRSAGTSLMTVINDVLDLSKIEAGHLILEDCDFSLTQLLSEVMGMFEATALQRELTLELDKAEGTPDWVRGDPGRLRQILVNLVGNSLKFTAQGSVTVRVAPDPASDPQMPKLVFTVEDTGIGMDEDAIERVFMPFAQADMNTARTYGGTGLGLAITKELVDAMGGQITVESTPGAGSRFCIVLPMSTGSDVTEEVPRPVQSQKATFEGLSTLVVACCDESDRTLNEDLRAMGASVDAVGFDVDQAIEMLTRSATSEKPYQLVILNVNSADPSPAVVNDAVSRLSTFSDIPLLVVVYPDYPSRLITTEGSWSLGLVPVQVQDLDDALAQNTTRRHSLRGAAAASSPGRILLVEDNEINQLVAQGMLDQLGYHVDLARDGEEALRMAEQGNYAAVLMDCQMPRMDGFEATKQMRLRERTATTPIIAMTASAFEDDRERCLEAGMDDFLTKPVTREELGEMLGRWLGKCSGCARFDSEKGICLPTEHHREVEQLIESIPTMRQRQSADVEARS